MARDGSRRRDDEDDDDSRERRRRRREEADEDLLELERRRGDSRRKNRLRRRRRPPEPPREKVSAEVLIFERILPIILITLGLVLSFLAAGGIGGENGMWRALAFMGGGLAAVIPITIGTLVVAGMLFGIDYGDLKGAVLKLAAVAIVNNAVLWVGEWMGFAFWAIPVAGIVCFGLFMLLFDLDYWEAGMSLVVVGLIQFCAKLMLYSLMLTQQRFEERKAKKESAAPPAVVVTCTCVPVLR